MIEYLSVFLNSFNYRCVKRFFLLLVFGLAFAQYNFGQNKVTPGKKDQRNPSPHLSHADSLRYIPKPVGWVNDFTGLFSTAEIKNLDSLIGNYEEKSTVEISVATVDTSITGPIEFDAYTLLMLRTWGVGKKEKNNGILIVIAPGMRRIRIQNGYGIEKFLSNDETKEIIDNAFLPYFKEAKFYEGTRQGILAIINKLSQNGYPLN